MSTPEMLSIPRPGRLTRKGDPRTASRSAQTAPGRDRQYAPTSKEGQTETPATTAEGSSNGSTPSSSRVCTRSAVSGSAGYRGSHPGRGIRVGAVAAERTGELGPLSVGEPGTHPAFDGDLTAAARDRR